MNRKIARWLSFKTEEKSEVSTEVPPGGGFFLSPFTATGPGSTRGFVNDVNVNVLAYKSPKSTSGDLKFYSQALS